MGEGHVAATAGLPFSVSASGRLMSPRRVVGALASRTAFVWAFAIATTALWFPADWVGGILWHDNWIESFVFAWMASLLGGLAVGIAFGAKWGSSRSSGRW